MSRPSSEPRTTSARVYIISVAAELAGVHPQTLRIYERKGLVAPQRTSGNTPPLLQIATSRLLRRIRPSRRQGGINLAGVKMIIELQVQLEALRAETEDRRSACTSGSTRRNPKARSCRSRASSFHRGKAGRAREDRAPGCGHHPPPVRERRLRCPLA